MAGWSLNPSPYSGESKKLSESAVMLKFITANQDSKDFGPSSVVRMLVATSEQRLRSLTNQEKSSRTLKLNTHSSF